MYKQPSSLRDLLELNQQCVDAVVKKPATLNFNVFVNNLRACTLRYKDTANKEAQALLLKAWQPYIAFALVGNVRPLTFSSDIKNYISLVLNFNIAKNMTTNVETAHLLACLCTTRVYHQNLNRHGNQDGDIERLISDVTQKPLHIVGKISLEDCVDLIYGNACWTLYRSDVDSDESLPPYLYKQGVSPVGLLKEPIDMTLQKNALPLDIVKF